MILTNGLCLGMRYPRRFSIKVMIRFGPNFGKMEIKKRINHYIPMVHGFITKKTDSWVFTFLGCCYIKRRKKTNESTRILIEFQNL